MLLATWALVKHSLTELRFLRPTPTKLVISETFFLAEKKLNLTQEKQMTKGNNMQKKTNLNLKKTQT